MKYLTLILILTLAACHHNDKKPSNNPEPIKKIAFVTDSEYSVLDIGGSGNLDQICQDEADLSPYTVGRSFLAFYSVNGLSFQDRAMQGYEPTVWSNFDERYSVSSLNRFVKSDILEYGYLPIAINQYGNIAGSFYGDVKAWSNTDALGYKTTNPAFDFDCSGLTSSSASDNTEYSTSHKTGENLTSCDVSMRVICVEI